MSQKSEFCVQKSQKRGLKFEKMREKFQKNEDFVPVWSA
jgi:hypothetical protein